MIDTPSSRSASAETVCPRCISAHARLLMLAVRATPSHCQSANLQVEHRRLATEQALALLALGRKRARQLARHVCARFTLLMRMGVVR